MAELITVPTFIFEQGDILDGGERPIQICYNDGSDIGSCIEPAYRDWETDRKSTRLNSSHITRSRMPSSA